MSGMLPVMKTLGKIVRLAKRIIYRTACFNAAPPTFDSLSERPLDADLPLLDRTRLRRKKLSAHQQQWRDEGVVSLRNFLPEDLMRDYVKVREAHPQAGGWQCPTPYMHVPELRALACYKPLADILTDLLGEPMGVHLNLTGWITSEREWHQDDYLNPDFINSWYAAVWMALDDIHPDSGPFQYIPGSHRWPVMRQKKVKELLSKEEAENIAWCSIAERFVTPLYEAEIARSGLPTVSLLAKRGDVLIWHGRLVHRGSRANVPGMPRRSLISHYSAVSKRRDMPDVAHTQDGVPYFVLNWPLDFQPQVLSATGT
jgi:hypothetical protein